MQRQTAYSSEKSSEMMHGMHGGKFPFRPFLFCSCVVKYYQPKTAEEDLLFEMVSAFAHGAASPVSGPAALLARRPVPSGGLTHDLSKFSPVEFAAGGTVLSGKPQSERDRAARKGIQRRMAAPQGPQPSSSGILDRLCGGRLGYVRHENAAEIRAGNVLRPRGRKQDLSRRGLPRQRPPMTITRGRSITTSSILKPRKRSSICCASCATRARTGRSRRRGECSGSKRKTDEKEPFS